MPFDVLFPLADAPPPSGGGLPPVLPPPGVVGGLPEQPCDAPHYTQNHFLRLFDRILPDDYIDPMKRGENRGYEVFQSAGAVGDRISKAVTRLQCGTYYTTAPCGSLATGTVEFFRDSAVSGAFTVLAGTVVTTSRHDRRFELTEDVVFGAGVIGPVSGSVRAIAEGYEWNLPGRRITAAGELLEGEIDTLVEVRLDPPLADLTLRVQQVVDTVGGAPPMLDGLGANRGIYRAAGESCASYRRRTTTIPDTVSPGAIVREVEAALDGVACSWEFVEEFSVQYQTCWDAPSPNPGTPTYQATPPLNPSFDDTLFAFDDDRPGPQNVWLSSGPGFVVYVDCPDAYRSVGFAYDDPGTSPADFDGSRGTPAYDGTRWDNPALIFPAAYDGGIIIDEGIRATLEALYSDLQRIKPAGVTATIILAPYA